MVSGRSFSPHEEGPPDVGFQAAVGFYVGTTLAGFGAVGGALAGVSSPELLATVPTLLTGGIVAGIVLGRHARGLPERLGSSRRYRLACWLSPLAVACLALSSLVTSASADTRVGTLAVVAVAVTTVVAFGVSRMARNRYVAAVTRDEPIATARRRWSETTRYGFTGFAVLLALLGLWIGSGDGGVAGLALVGYGVVYLVTEYTAVGDEREQWNPPEVRVHEAGVVVKRSVSRKLYPWETIEDVRLTDDELVFARRRRFDVRCDREDLEDPEAVYEDIERTRADV